MKQARIVVLISGSGSNLQAIIDSCERSNSSAKVVAVFSNRPNVKGLERAKNHKIPSTTLNHKAFDNRENFDQTLSTKIDGYKPDLIVLAGFMRILSNEFVEHFLGRMINIHPSLLPKYPGLNTHKRALEAGDTHHGTTVHFVTPELDGGPAIIQAQVPILPNDNEDSLAKRVLKQEHIIYPMAVQWFAQGQLHLKNDQCFLNNKALTFPYRL